MSARSFSSVPLQADKDNQAAYLIDHGITDNENGTFTIDGGGTDFDYFVQIGNKGTWSTAHVDVTAPSRTRATISSPRTSTATPIFSNTSTRRATSCSLRPHIEHVAACDLRAGAPAPARQDMQSKQSFCFLR